MSKISESELSKRNLSTPKKQMPVKAKKKKGFFSHFLDYFLILNIFD